MQGRQVIEWHLAEARQLRLEPIVKSIRGGHGAETTAVTGVAHRDDPRRATAMQLPPLARQFDRSVAGFGAAVEKMHLIAAGAFTQPLGQIQLPLVVKSTSGVDQPVGLVGQSPSQNTGAVTETVAPAALAEIQISLALRIPHRRALATHEHRSETRDSRHQVFMADAVLSNGLPVLSRQVIKTWRRTPQTEQVHARRPSRGKPSNRADQSSTRPLRSRLMAVSRQREDSAGQSISFFRPACSRGS